MNQITAPIRLQALLKCTEPIPIPSPHEQQRALTTHNPFEPTVLLVKALVNLYIQKYGCFPQTIDLVDFRYWAMQIACYEYYYVRLPHGTCERIPYRLAEGAIFEVRVRGTVQ